MKKRRLAIEWLLFLSSILIGAVIVPLLLLPLVIRSPNPSYHYSAGDFYAALVSKDAPIAWIIVLSPYLLIQIVRSVIWAVGMLKKNEEA